MMDEELTAHAEKSDGYHGVIIRLNALWRVAVCDARIQWSSASRATGIRLASSWATRRTADGLQLANPRTRSRDCCSSATRRLQYRRAAVPFFSPPLARSSPGRRAA